jgi:hypothetical protein
MAVLLATSARHGSRVIGDMDRVRAIHYAMVVGFQGGNDFYPLPSKLDKLGYTTGITGRSLDTTSNIFSLLVYCGALRTEHLVSPLENNSQVRPCRGYEFDRPSTAAQPDMALWDPQLSATLDGSRLGNISYAHLQPGGERLKRWSNTFVSEDPVVGTRGPEIAAEPGPDGSPKYRFINPRSHTLFFFRTQPNWSGHTAFNDNHVEFRESLLGDGQTLGPKWTRRYDASSTHRPNLKPDHPFFDEPDDPKAANDFLGIFLKAGPTPADFKATWD